MASTREQILDAAGRLIHLQGFHKTSVDDILRESGVGKGNLYYYFKSKDELGYAALERTLERIQGEVLERVFAQGVDPWTQLERFLNYPVERARKEGGVGGCPLGNLALEMSDIHEGFRARLSQAFERVQSKIEETLERARGHVANRNGHPTFGAFRHGRVRGCVHAGEAASERRVGGKRGGRTQSARCAILRGL
jgi:TetR/AcrR family transcriptional repressor of nem operon